jgi:hypothetical protein
VIRRAWLCAAVLGLIAAPWAAAELRLTLSIEGSPEEIMAILRQIQQSGTGAQGDAGGDDTLRLRVFSATGDPGAAPEAAATPPAEPPITLHTALVSPPSSPPGAPILLTVRVRDLEQRVDTVSGWIPAASQTADLYDNGQGGDVTAGDGIWSTTLLVPETLPDGAHEIALTAYDANGDVIAFTGPDDVRQPVTASTQILVQRATP